MDRGWNPDAENIAIDRVDQGHLNSILVRTPIITEFLHTGRGDRKWVIAGPKGMGKTLLLKIKSKIYRDQHKGFLFIPEGPLVEKFTSLEETFPGDTVHQFSTINSWRKIWKLSIYCTIIRSIEYQLDSVQTMLPPEVSELIGKARRLPDVLGAFLPLRSRIEVLYRKYISRELQPIVRDLGTYFDVEQVAMFIDNVDEAFRSQRNDESGSDVWSMAQIALIDVVRELCAANNDLKIFVAARAEVLELFPDEMRLQLKSYIARPYYSTIDLRKIFSKNIRLMATHNLVSTHANSELKKFLGFDRIEHSFVIDENGSRETEGVFDFILRHTFGRPREIVEMGRRIALCLPGERTRTRVAEIVNETSSDLMEQYSEEIVPKFEKSVFDVLVRQIGCNVVRRDDAKVIAKTIEAEVGFKGVFSYLWRLGIVGATESTKPGGPLVQRFQPVGKYTPNHARDVPAGTNYLVLHPATDKAMQQVHDKNFYQTSNIIGNGRSFNPPIDTGRSRSAVLIGLSEDHLSSVIHALAEQYWVTAIHTQSPGYGFRATGDVRVEASGREQLRLRFDPGAHVNVWSMERRLDRIVADDNIPQTRAALEASSLIVTRSLDALRQVLASTSADWLDSPPSVLVVSRHFKSSSRKQLRELVAEYRLSPEASSLCIVDCLTHFVDWQTRSIPAEIRVSCETNRRLVVSPPAPQHLSRSGLVRVVPSQKQFEAFNSVSRYLVEGTYRLFKLEQEQNIRRDASRHTVYRLFWEIQTERLTQNRKKQLLDLYQTTSLTQLRARLIEEGERALSRFEKSRPPGKMLPNFVRETRSRGIFPSDKNYYSIAPRCRSYEHSPSVISLMKLLNVQNLPSMHSVFISYSHIDTRFASKMRDVLVKSGCEVFMFEKDATAVALDSMMAEQVTTKSRVLFISSRSSLRSTPCHYELSLTRKKAEAMLEHILIPIRLDDYMLTVTETDIPSSRRALVWGNIEFLRASVAFDFSKYNTDIAQQPHLISEFETLVKARVLPGLRVRR